MAFSGWPRGPGLLRRARADNTKTYWTHHKAVYTEKILAPMTDPAEDLAAEFGEPKISGRIATSGSARKRPVQDAHRRDRR